MPIPASKDFSIALRTLYVETNKNQLTSNHLILARDFYDGKTRVDLHLCQQPGSVISLDRLIARVSLEVQPYGKEQRLLCALTLAILTRQPAWRGNEIEMVNEVFCQLEPHQFWQYAVWPFKGSLPPEHAFGSFWMGSFAKSTFENVASAAHEKVLLLAERMLQAKPLECIAVERKAGELAGLSGTLLDATVASGDSANELLVYRYYDVMSRVRADEFWSDFEREQNPLVACGGPRFNWHLVFKQMCTMVSVVFTCGKYAGLFFQRELENTDSISGLLSPSLSRDILASQDLLARLDVSRCDPVLRDTMQRFCACIYRASAMKLDGRLEESFVRYFMSLDLTFGSRSDDDALSRRVALITHLHLKEQLEPHYKRIVKIISQRNTILHQGGTVRSGDVDFIETLSRSSIEALYRIASTHVGTDSEILNRWMKKRDYFWVALDAGELVPPSQMLEWGIHETSVFP